jgi:hypothetical protein
MEYTIVRKWGSGHFIQGRRDATSRSIADVFPMGRGRPDVSETGALGDRERRGRVLGGLSDDGLKMGLLCNVFTRNQREGGDE